MSYAGRFSASDFVEKISRVAKRAGAKMVYAALILYYTLQSDKVPVKDKAIILGALGYLILPLDLIPDAIPLLGFTDDAAAIKMAYDVVKRNVTPEIENKANWKLSQWF